MRPVIRYVDAVLLVVQAVGVFFVAALLAQFIHDYHVSLAHLPVGPAVTTLWIGAAVGALFFLCCAVAAAWAPAVVGAVRLLLVGCAIVQGVAFLAALLLLDPTVMLVLAIAFAVHLATVLDTPRPAAPPGETYGGARLPDSG